MIVGVTLCVLLLPPTIFCSPGNFPCQLIKLLDLDDADVTNVGHQLQIQYSKALTEPLLLACCFFWMPGAISCQGVLKLHRLAAN